MSAPDRCGAGFRQSEVPDLALLNQVFHRARDVFDGNVRIDAVLIEQVDHVGLQPLERGFGDLLDVRRPAIEASRSIGFERETELRRDNDLTTERSERLSDELFIDERAVRFGGVEQRDSALDGRSKERRHLLLVARGAVAEAHAHAAKPER